RRDRYRYRQKLVSHRGSGSTWCDRAAPEVVPRPVEIRLANLPPCLIGMEACVGAHHLSRKLTSLGHDARLMPAKYVRPYSRGQKNDFRDAEAIAEAVQRPTMKFVTTKTAEQLDLQALHRVRERLVSQRTGIINQTRAFLLERGIAVRQGLRFLRAALPRILATPHDVLSPRMVHVIEDLAGDWNSSTSVHEIAETPPPLAIGQLRLRPMCDVHHKWSISAQQPAANDGTLTRPPAAVYF